MADFVPQQFKLSSSKFLTIRHFNLKDLDKLQLFFKKGIEETNHTLLCKEKLVTKSTLREKLENIIPSPSEIYIGAFDQNTIVGSLQLKSQNPDHPWIKHVGQFGMLVLEDYWGQGIGRKLLEIMDNFALTIGVSRIESSVRHNNERGIKFYLKAGFKIEGTREKCAFIDGQFVDEYFIAKVLI